MASASDADKVDIEARPRTASRFSWPRSPTSPFSYALTALSPSRRRRARTERAGENGRCQLPFDVWLRIAEHLRTAEGGGAIDNSPIWNMRGYQSPWASNEDLVAQAWRITVDLMAAGTTLPMGGARGATVLRHDAAKRRPLLCERARDLCNLRLTSREWDDAAKTSHAVCQAQYDTIMLAYSKDARPTRFQRVSGWPALVTLLFGFLAQGPVAVAIVSAMRGEGASAAVYEASLVGCVLVLAIGSAVGGVFAVSNAENHVNGLTGSLLILFTSLGAIVGATAASTRAFSLPIGPLTAAAAAASPLLFLSWTSTFASAAFIGADPDYDDAATRVLTGFFLVLSWGLHVAAFATASRVANDLSVDVGSVRQGAAAGAGAAAVSSLAAIAFAISLVSTLFRDSDDDDPWA